MPGFSRLLSHQEPGFRCSKFVISEKARAVQVGESGKLLSQFSTARRQGRCRRGHYGRGPGTRGCVPGPSILEGCFLVPRRCAAAGGGCHLWGARNRSRSGNRSEQPGAAASGKWHEKVPFVGESRSACGDAIRFDGDDCNFLRDSRLQGRHTT